MADRRQSLCLRCGADKGENCRTKSGRRLHIYQTHACRGRTDQPNAPVNDFICPIPQEYRNIVSVALKVLAERCAADHNVKGCLLVEKTHKQLLGRSIDGR